MMLDAMDPQPTGIPHLIRPPTPAEKRACRMLLQRATGAGQMARLFLLDRQGTLRCFSAQGSAAGAEPDLVKG